MWRCAWRGLFVGAAYGFLTEGTMMQVGTPFKIFGGMAMRAVPLAKWRRPDGEAAFLANLIALRKTLVLCAGCENKMPRRWLDRVDYALVKAFSAEGTTCDYCRKPRPVNMYLPVDGKYHQELVQSQKSVDETRARQRELYNKDRRYLLG